MNDWTPEDRELLDRARGGYEPTAADRARVRAGLAASLGLGAGLTVGTTALSATATPLLAAKVFVGLAVLGAFGGGAALVHRAHRASGPSQPVGVATTASAAPRVSAMTTAPDVPTSVVALAPTVPSAQEAPAASSMTVVASAKAASHPAPVLAVAPSKPVTSDRSPAGNATSLNRGDPLEISVSGEARLLSRAVEALHAGDAARALSLLDEHGREYPAGVLAEERDAERVIALCQLGRVSDARAAARPFLLGQPSSALGRRVRDSCGGTPNP